MAQKSSARSSKPVAPKQITPSRSKVSEPQAVKKANSKSRAAVTNTPVVLVASRSNSSSHGSQTAQVSRHKGTAGTAAKGSSNGSDATSQLLNRAEQDILSAIESLNTQMNTALTALAGLASVQAERGRAVVRTAPLDRATATFQRLVSEVVDDQLGEMLPPLIALRNEMGQWAAGGQEGSPEAEFHQRGVQTLDHVLTLAGASSFDARPGQAFDPLIHLAVGEARREDLPEGAVVECIQAGFRSARGKVLTPARVRINRR